MLQAKTNPRKLIAYCHKVPYGEPIHIELIKLAFVWVVTLCQVIVESAASLHHTLTSTV